MPTEDSELIDYPHVGVGMYLTLKNSKRLFEDAKFLYDSKKFHNAIPLFIISIEESLKSQELSIKMRKKESIKGIISMRGPLRDASLIFIRRTQIRHAFWAVFA